MTRQQTKYLGDQVTLPLFDRVVTLKGDQKHGWSGDIVTDVYSYPATYLRQIRQLLLAGQLGLRVNVHIT
jgi:hypothetical protein